MSESASAAAKRGAYSIYTAIGTTEGRPDLFFTKRKLNLAPGELPDVGIFTQLRRNMSHMFSIGLNHIHMVMGAKIFQGLH